jgi:acid phosphatase type 7
MSETSIGSVSRREALGILSAPLIAGIAGCRPGDLTGPTTDYSASSASASSGALSESITLIGAGDQHAVARPAARAETARLIRSVLDADPTARAFTLGDLTHHGSEEEHQYYDETWGAFRERTLFVMGNHDVMYTDPPGAAYYAYTGAPRYQAQTLGAWRCYVLNCEPKNKNGADQAQQMAWLRADLDQYSATHHILVMCHYPLFASVCAHHLKTMTFPLRVQPWWQLLQAHRAELVLSGHAHRWERFRRKLADGTVSEAGIRQFLIGTGGVLTRGVVAQDPDSEKVVVEHGVARFDLHPDHYEWTFTDIHGTVRDRGSQMCHAG